eukprot:TRINITY_DN66249_c4_g8_i1.p1 TRINITY_DN66249_c4_g8~~TRINITY_DN66249_c4_g8_i1.p1  ORF type:complete len:521 (+),score=107.67 TRINITY_DN66249_c4_g8_i1:28-1590(+)
MAAQRALSGLCLLFLIGASLAGDVLEWQSADFWKFREENPNTDVMVQFYAPWCSACKAFAPIYEKAAAKLKGKVVLAKMDAYTDQSLGVRFEVEAYPTVKLFQGNTNFMFEYEGNGNTVTEVVEWATEPKETMDAKPAPEKFTPEQEERLAGIMNMMKEKGLIGEDGLPVANPEAALQQEPEDNSVPEGPSSVIALTDADWKSTIQGKGGVWMVKFYAPWCGHCKAMVPTYEKLAKAMDSEAEINIAKIDATENTEVQELFEVGGFPTLVVIRGDEFWNYEGGRTQKEMEEFVKGGYLKDDAPGKKIPTPLQIPEGPSAVEVITEANINLIETDTWMLEFYAPWCGHCKKLAPHWEILAHELKTHPDGAHIRVAKIDVTTNEAIGRRFGVESFPTIIRTQGGHTMWKHDSADRTATALVDWAVSGHSSAESSHIPPPPTMMDEIGEILGKVKQDITVLWNYKKLSLSIIFAAGVVFGAFLVAVLTPTPKPRKRKTAAATPPSDTDKGTKSGKSKNTKKEQ